MFHIQKHFGAMCLLGVFTTPSYIWYFLVVGVVYEPVLSVNKLFCNWSAFLLYGRVRARLQRDESRSMDVYALLIYRAII